jgi:eukaryotic-like serine/threonine-protein kinase
MQSPVPPKPCYRFGLFRVDRDNGKLLRQGVPVKIQEQPLRVLCLLLERAGQIVTREELRQSLWSEGTYVEFDGSLNAALKRLRLALGDDADNPIFIETVPRRGYRFIAPVEIEETLKAEPAERTGPQFELRTSIYPRSTNAWRIALLTAIFVILAVGIVTSYHRIVSAKEKSRVASQVPIRMRPSVAILGFNNISARETDAWLNTGFSEMLSTELAAGGKLRLVSAEQVSELKKTVLADKPSTLSGNTLGKIRQDLGADYVVLGAYSVLPTATPQVRIDLRLQDTAAGETVTSISETGSEADLFQLVSRVGARLRDRLAMPMMPGDEAGVQASLSSNPETERWYAEGLEKLRAFDALGARELLERAVAADPNFALARSALAEAWSDLGYDAKAQDESKKAFELAQQLPGPDRLLIEGRYRELSHQWDNAVSIYRTLFDFFPDEIEYGLRLANAQKQGGKKDQAALTVQRLRKLPVPVAQDARIDLAEEQNLEGTGQYQAAVDVTARAISKARANDLRLLLAQALCRQGSVLALLGEGDKAIAAAEEARNIYSVAGDQFGAAASLVVIGKVQYLRGDYEAGERIFQQTVVTDRSIGHKSGEAFDLRFLANGRAVKGDLQGAKRFYEQALAIYREIDDRAHVAYTLTETAWVYKAGGQPMATLPIYNEALSLFRDMQDQQGVALVLDEKCNVSVTLGELEQGRQACEEALGLFRKSGEKNLLTRTLSDLANIDSIEDKLEESRAMFNEALNMDRQSGDQGQAVWVTLGLAEVAMEEGHLEEAKHEVQDALNYLHQHADSNDEINAQSLLAEIALTEGNLVEAHRALDAAGALLHTHQGWTARYIYTITDARLETADGKLSGARSSLISVLNEAKKHNYVHYELEARLALCEVEAKTNPASALAHEKVLEQEARQKQFGMIARKAQALANRIG